MKKVLLGLLIVLSVLICFVGCKEVEPKVKEVESVSFKGNYIVTFYKNGGGMVFIDSNRNEVWDEGEVNYVKTTTVVSGVIVTNDSKEVDTLTIYTPDVGGSDFSFYKQTNKPISSWKDLIGLDTIYDGTGCGFEKIK